MRHQEATTIVPAPLAQVEAFVADVEGWPRFLVGLERAERRGHERYRFALRDDGDQREVTVAVRRDTAAHCIAWKALEGPVFRGRIELSAVDTRHTSVRMQLWAHPGSLAAGVADMVMPRMDRAERDLQGLAEHLTALSR